MKNRDYIDLSECNQPFEGLIPAFAKNIGEEYMTGKLEGASDYLEVIDYAKVREYIANNVKTPKYEGQFASFEGFVSKVAIEGNDRPEPEPWPVNTILTLTDGTKVEIEGERLTYNMVGSKYGSKLKSAIVGSSVKRLEDGNSLQGVFSSSSNDSKLESIQLPDTLEYIGGFAFCGCMRLKELIIPDSVTYIGRNILTNLLLTNPLAVDIYIKLPNNSDLVIDNKAFEQGVPQTLFSIDVPSTVKRVGSGAFSLVYNVNYTGDLNTSKWGAKHYNCYADGYLLYTDNTKANLIDLSPNTNGTLIIPNTVTNDVSELFINLDYGVRKRIKNLILGDSIIVSDNAAFTDILNVEYHGSDTNAPWGANFLNAYIEGNVVYLDNTKTTLVGSAGGYIIIPESVTTIDSKATITEGATISKLYNTYTKPSLFNDSQTVRFDDVDSNTFTGDYNVSVLFAKGTSKLTRTYTIYTDDQTIYNQMKSFGAKTSNYVIVNLYHLNGSAWE